MIPPRTIGDPIAVARMLVALRSTPPAELAKIALALGEVRDSWNAVPILLKLLKHKAVPVRLAACQGLAAHAVPTVMQALFDASQDDRSPAVREEADQIHGLLWEPAVLCAQGCGSTATLKPDPEHYGDYLQHAAFCSDRCAARWALARINDEMHLCRTRLEWTQGPEKDCETCQEAALIGVESPTR